MDRNKFDCRYINHGIVCEYLSPWIKVNSIAFDMARICTCKALNVVIFPEFKDYGKINQKLIQVKPIFQCPKMQEHRKQGNSSSIIATITNKEIVYHE